MSHYKCLTNLDIKDKNVNHAYKAVNELLNRWGLTFEEKSALMGINSQENPIKFDSIVIKRIITVLDIDSELKLYFNNPKNIFGYMTMVNNNPPFCGRKPLEIALASPEGLDTVYRYLCCMRAP